MTAVITREGLSSWAIATPDPAEAYTFDDVPGGHLLAGRLGQAFSLLQGYEIRRIKGGLQTVVFAATPEDQKKEYYVSLKIRIKHLTADEAFAADLSDWTFDFFQAQPFTEARAMTRAKVVGDSGQGLWPSVVKVGPKGNCFITAYAVRRGGNDQYISTPCEWYMRRPPEALEAAA